MDFSPDLVKPLVCIGYRGRREYEATLPNITKVVELIGGQLTDERKIQLMALLDELNDFHASLHKEAKKLTLDELLDKAL